MRSDLENIVTNVRWKKISKFHVNVVHHFALLVETNNFLSARTVQWHIMNTEQTVILNKENLALSLLIFHTTG